MQQDFNQSPFRKFTKDLDYFLSLQDAREGELPELSSQNWDQRAESWEKKRQRNQKGFERVASAMDYLENRGLLKPEFQVADVGCGPAYFAAAFARKVQWVTGFDLSPRMIHYGQEHAQREGVQNLTLQVCDFKALDVEKAGLKGAFDLVFSSLTPAIHGAGGVQKLMDMSRAYCCNITHIFRDNSVRRQIQQEVFGLEPVSPFGGRSFYALFNTLLLMGYLPETTYDRQILKQRVSPTEDYAAMMMEQILPAQEQTPQNQARILKWLEDHADKDGLITEIGRACYGRILWDVRLRSVVTE